MLKISSHRIMKIKPVKTECLRNGQAIDSNHIRSTQEWTCKQSGIVKFTIHDVRHTCINNWRKERHDYFKIMAHQDTKQYRFLNATTWWTRAN